MTNETETTTETKQTASNADMRKTLLFISGMGTLGFIFAMILFGGDIFGGQTADPNLVTGVQVSDFPDVAPGVNTIIDEPELDGAIAIDDIAPNFTLLDLDGNEHSLGDLRGQPVIINFWASWCGPCRIEMPELEQAFADHADDGLVILAINREEDPQTVQEFFYDELDLSFTPLLDPDASIAEGYGVFNMPTTYFVNTDGVVTYVHRGPITAEQITANVEFAMQSQ